MTVAALKHKWGPWISRHDLWGGEPHRRCTCGRVQWIDEPDPHTEAESGTAA